MTDFIEATGKFIDGLVRPMATLGLLGVIGYLAVTKGSTETVQATITLAGVAMTFWFGQRAADKAADVAASAAKSLAATAAGATTPVPTTDERNLTDPTLGGGSNG